MELFKDPYGILTLAAAKSPPKDEEEDSFWNKKMALQVKPRKTRFWRKKLQKHDQCKGAFR